MAKSEEALKKLLMDDMGIKTPKKRTLEESLKQTLDKTTPERPGHFTDLDDEPEENLEGTWI